MRGRKSSTLERSQLIANGERIRKQLGRLKEGQWATIQVRRHSQERFCSDKVKSMAFGL